MSGTILIVLAVVLLAAVLVFLRRDRPRRIGGGSAPTGPAARDQSRAAEQELTPDARQRPAEQEPVPDTGLSPADFAEVARDLAEGRKIMAIKLVREKTGMGLKDAKDFVEGPAFDGKR